MTGSWYEWRASTIFPMHLLPRDIRYRESPLKARYYDSKRNTKFSTSSTLCLPLNSTTNLSIRDLLHDFSQSLPLIYEFLDDWAGWEFIADISRGWWLLFYVSDTFAKLASLNFRFSCWVCWTTILSELISLSTMIILAS